MPRFFSSNIDFSYNMCLKGMGILELPFGYHGIEDLVEVFKDEEKYVHRIYVGAQKIDRRSRSVSVFLDFLKSKIKYHF